MGGLSARWNAAARGFLSRISIRLMAFNLLLVFLPVAAIIYLGSYEQKLLAAQWRMLDEEARLLSASLTIEGEPFDRAQAILDQRSHMQPAINRIEPVRLRVVSPDGTILADSHSTAVIAKPRVNPARRNILYRVGAKIVKLVLRLFKANPPALPPAETYERLEKLTGPEVRAAMKGSAGRAERISPDDRSVTNYVAHPLREDGEVIGAVVASQSTFTILQDLYTVRLGIIRIFAVSVIAALVISFLVATTIVGPLRRLRLEAGSILDRRGRLRGRFKGSRKQDEIGDLSRALEGLTARLDEHVRFIETFAADVSHEFRNPLASIRTATEMLSEVEEPAQRKRFRRMVEQDIARMESLLSGVREITIIDAQMPTEARQRIDVAAMLGRIVEGFQLREQGRIEIRLDTSGECEVMASEDRLIQAFINVLENAISFSPENSVVTISVRRENMEVVTSIADQGPGIPESNLARVFDRFFSHRPDTTRARRSHTGLGLAIVKAVVDGYGGSVSASNNPEGGARFEIRLPAA